MGLLQLLLGRGAGSTQTPTGPQPFRTRVEALTALLEEAKTNEQLLRLDTYQSMQTTAWQRLEIMPTVVAGAINQVVYEFYRHAVLFNQTLATYYQQNWASKPENERSSMDAFLVERWGELNQKLILLKDTLTKAR